MGPFRCAAGNEHKRLEYEHNYPITWQLSDDIYIDYGRFDLHGLASSGRACWGVSGPPGALGPHAIGYDAAMPLVATNMWLAECASPESAGKSRRGPKGPIWANNRAKIAHKRGISAPFGLHASHGCPPPPQKISARCASSQPRAWGLRSAQWESDVVAIQAHRKSPYLSTLLFPLVHKYVTNGW